MTTAVVLMAYGGPASLDEVEGYYTDIRRGRPPASEALEDLKERYRKIGGSSPLLRISKRQAAALETHLNATHPGAYRTFVGMKHWHPYIAATMKEVAEAGISKVIGLALAPHYSKMSIGGYEDRLVQGAKAAGAGIEVSMIESWYDQSEFIEFSAGNLRSTVEDWQGSDEKFRVFFTAHSLPTRILEDGDPYKDQLLDSSKRIADAAGVEDWEFAFQSASHTGEPWLGPDVLERLEAFSVEGGQRAVVAPIGFVADHLEILFDVDVECAEQCKKLGLAFRRTPSPNDHPGFIEALAAVVLRHDSR